MTIVNSGAYKLKNKAWNMYLNLQAKNGSTPPDNGDTPNVWEFAQHADQEWYLEPANIQSITGLSLPITATNGSATWKIDDRGGVTGAISYTVGSGSGSKKYSSGVVVEFLDGSTYNAEMTKTVGRPLTGKRKGTHTENRPSISLNQVSQVRRVFVKYEVDRGLDTIGVWKDLVLDILDDANTDYQKLKDNGLVQDAAKAAAKAAAGS